MKKLIVLENINGNFGKLADGQLYPYTEETGTLDTWYDIYLIDTEKAITKDCWFVDIYNELMHSSDVTIDDVTKHYIVGIVIASTDIRTKLPAINQVVVDAFLESNCKNNIVETMEFGDGSHEIMLVSEFENEWVGADLSLNLTEL